MSKLEVTLPNKGLFLMAEFPLFAHIAYARTKPHDGLNSFDGINDPGIIQLPENTKQLYIAHHGSTIWHGIYILHVVSF